MTDKRNTRTEAKPELAPPSDPAASRSQNPNALLAIQALTAASDAVQQAICRPDQLISQPLALAKTWAEILTGRSDLEPDRGDRRFKDEAWRVNPLYHAMMQGHLALQSSLDSYIADLGLNDKNREQMRLIASNLMDALAPTNSLLGNPQALKKAYDTGGQSLLKGVGQYIDDLMKNGGMPGLVDKSAFKVGENLATTPGKVVYRTEMMELIQYQPSTDRVYARPLLMVPPQINKFYVYDIAPGRSLIEYAVAQGFQVFAVSWRNSTADQRDWGFDTYVKALEQATEVVCEVADSDNLNMLGACSGGITAATLTAYLAARDTPRINSFSLMVSVLDAGATGDTALGLFAQRDVLELAKVASSSAGVLDGRELAKIFAWLRPNDLVWSCWVNNYLLGNPLPAFDLLYWNSDTTNLPARLHADFLGLIDDNPLLESDKLRIDGTPIDLKKVRCDAYVIGGTTDHITPWQACYRTVEMLGGETRFVLSSSGHVQAIINPPGNPRASFLTTDTPCPDADTFLNNAQEHEGSWWDHWQAWLGERSGEQIDPPRQLGTADLPPLDDAPGTYVLVR